MIGVVAELDEEEKIIHLKVSIGACSPVARRLRLFEQEAVGQKIQSLEINSKHIESLEPIDDIRSTAEYRKKVIPELLKRAINGVVRQ